MLKDILSYEKDIYISKDYKERLYRSIIQDERVLFYRYMVLLRKEEYCRSRRGIFNKVCGLFYSRRKNCLGNRIDVKILPFTVGKGLNIQHKGIVINGVLGEDCILHGRNTIGNNRMGGHGPLELPHLGDRVDIGVGAVIIGNVTVADNVKIGANSVVTKSIDEDGTVCAGVPAHKIR